MDERTAEVLLLVMLYTNRDVVTGSRKNEVIAAAFNPVTASLNITDSVDVRRGNTGG
ncbi:MAG: hypothetical protein QXX41_01165 [Nitrososphaerota archaeon]